MDQENQRRLKVVFLGDRAVGKSSIISRFITNQFDSDMQPTVGVDFMGKNVKFQNKNYRIELWDTAGQQKYRSLVRGYLRGADACIFVYDCTNINTYTSIPEWLGLFDSVANPNSYRVIVGNKLDAEVNAENLEQTKTALKEDNQNLRSIPEFKTSAKLGINIEQLFEHILTQFTAERTTNAAEPLNQVLTKTRKWASSNCCK